MRTEQEIAKRIRDLAGADIFGFERASLLDFLPWESAKEFLKPEIASAGAEQSGWKVHTGGGDAGVKAEMKDYMAFAWEKALGHRGLSAGRSVVRFRAWCWLIGDDDAVAFIDDEKNFPYYGVPILRYLSRRYAFLEPEGEEVDRMAGGKRCREDCEECGG